MVVYFMLEPAHKTVHHAKTANPPQWGSMPRHPRSTDAESSFQPLGGSIACPAPARQRTACTADQLASLEYIL